MGPFGVSFWGRFGSPNGGQKRQKVVPKSHSKTGLKNDRCLINFGRFWGPFGVPNGARKVQIRVPKSDLASSRVLGGLQGSIWHLFLVIFGPMLRWFWCASLTYRSTCAYVFETLPLAFRLGSCLVVSVLACRILKFGVV